MTNKLKYFSMFSGIGGFELGIQRACDYQYAHRSETAGQAEPHEDLRQMRQRQAVPEVPRGAGGIRSADEQPAQLRPRDGTAALCVGYSEIDQPAIKTYEEHFTHENYGDAATIDPGRLPDFDLLVGGFPCQAFSAAGKRAGFDDTRGTLFFEIARLLKDKRPRHILLENVKGLLTHDTGKTFQTIVRVLADLGYRAEWQLFNSKDHGVPQNRERVFIVGHLRGGCAGQILPIAGGGRPHTDTTKPAGHGAHFATIDNRSQPNLRKIVSSQAIDGNYGRGLDGHGQRTVVLAGMRIRRLTPRECERLQGFPDDWTVGSDAQRYKQCGNAVTVNVVEAVMRKMLEHING